ncbi:uncharacterized protein LOC132544768 [Ylistrum balloti]|uniref:uncharacterized protein LOC132544768 n=1 Tax=Ylistrum balloti TaxID=509963 RepID=UPI0029059E24|nr:uncharacterized protein LOC132544768 [Ylistrum balloti]
MSFSNTALNTHYNEVYDSHVSIKRPRFVLGMLTSHANTAYRDGQRSTWLSTVNMLQNQLPFTITYKFLIDRPTNETIIEQKVYNDIVFLNVTSQGRAVRFGEKLYVWFKYIYENYPDVLLGAKVDDDVFLCVPQVFTRIDQLKSTKLYYGWTHGSGQKINTRTRMDEMFVVLGRELLERISKRKYCYGRRCNPSIDLIDTNFGGTSLGSWLSIYDDVDYRPDNNIIVHIIDNEEIKQNIKPNFCSKFILNHKSSVEIMKQLHEHNNRLTSLNISYTGAVTGSLFSGDVIRSGLPKVPTKQYQCLAVLDKIPACDNWAVVTTIFPPSKAVKYISSLLNWCLVIVADTKTPPEAAYLSEIELNKETSKTVKYLSLEEQYTLYPLLADVIPIQHFGRKNIGYMYAIHHKAKYIWDFDDDNNGIVDLDDFKTDHFDYVTICNTTHNPLMNPYPYFGVTETYTWPRGFPLQDIKNKTSMPNFCHASDTVHLGIVQSLANQQPDIDAIYRLTRDAPFTFRATTKSHLPIVVPANMFAPFNAQATLWLPSAFPYLALPISVNGRVSDIWRSYIAQFFLHQNDVRLAFSPPYVTQERNTHNILRDFNAELDLYQKSKQFVNLLSSETSRNHPNLLELFKDLYSRGYLEEADIQFADAWAKTFAIVKK